MSINVSSNIKKPKVFVAMSGGVDSSVAALLLKNAGYDVAGAHMLCWEECANNEDKQDALRVAAILGTPFLVWDFKKEYKEAVYNYMIREYMAGGTPNPDVMCNKEIKFGIFLKRALEAGADFIATGHYVRLDAVSHKLYAAKDLNKDQSYFLWTLTQDQLKQCLFPIGDYLKSEVRDLARKFNLSTAEKKDSQGLCFVGKVDFMEFLKNELPVKSGEVKDSSGKTLGYHEGAHFYTIGQRHGLALGGQPQPVYVVQKNMATNTLVVAKSAEDPILYKKELLAENFNWISGEAPAQSRCFARIRYRQPLQSCAFLEGGRIVFNQPQRAVAPGQSIVFYDEDKTMFGGGIIKA